MTILLLSVHVIACLLLIVIILIQAGRGGGLVDSLSNVESMLGTKTSALLTRATSVLSIVFFVTCLSLALLSARQSRSLMHDLKPAAGQAAQPAAVKGEADESAQPAAAKKEASQLPSAPAQQKQTPEAPKAE